MRKEIQQEVTLAPGESRVVVDLYKAGIGSFRKEHILYAELTDSTGKLLASADTMVDIERNIAFPASRLNVQVEKGALVITSDTFAKCVMVEGNDHGDKFGWFFEDNYFNLMPDQTQTVRMFGDHTDGIITARAFYSPHETTVEWER